MSNRSATTKSFATIDDTGSATFFAEYLDFVRSVPSMTAVEEVIARQTTEVNPVVVFDVGCGTGDFLASLVTNACPAAIGIGVEKSSLLMHLARQRHAHASRVTFVAHDFASVSRQVMISEFGDWIGYADVVILNRVVQHVVEPTRLLENLRFLLKVGGRIIVADVDWGQAQLNGPNTSISSALLEEHSRVMINPRAGFNLTRTLASAGFADAKLTATITHQFTDIGDADTIFSLSRAAARLIERGSLRPSDFEGWVIECCELMTHGHFQAYLPQMVAVATIPDPS